MTGSARLAAACVALVATIGLGVQLAASTAVSGTIGAALWAMLRFFTVIANLLIAALFGAIAFGARRASRPVLLGGVTLAILLVGVVYALLLRGLVDLSGAARLADTLLHIVTPPIVALYWLFFAPKGGLRLRDPLLWALLPLGYFAYALARAAVDGHYPYPFMNVARLGWAAAFGNALAIAAAFLLAGALLVALDRWLAPRR